MEKNEQIMNQLRTSHENVTNHEQAINKLLPSNEQVMKKSRTSHENVINKSH